MNYIVYFDVAALAVYVFILVYFLLEKGIYKLQNKIFMAMAINGLVSSILDISSSILINRAAEVENTFFTSKSAKFENTSISNISFNNSSILL